MNWFDEFAKALGGEGLSRREALRRTGRGLFGGLAAACGLGLAAGPQAQAGPVENACSRSCRRYGGITANCVQSCAACANAGHSLCQGVNGGLFCCAGTVCPLDPRASGCAQL